MSGGSFNYLCLRDVSDIFKDEEIDHMADRLSELGYDAKKVAAGTARVIELREQLRREIDDIRSVWRAVEWRDSCDIGDAQMWKTIGAWEEQRRVS